MAGFFPGCLVFCEGRWPGLVGKSRDVTDAFKVQTLFPEYGNPPWIGPPSSEKNMQPSKKAQCICFVHIGIHGWFYLLPEIILDIWPKV